MVKPIYIILPWQTNDFWYNRGGLDIEQYTNHNANVLYTHRIAQAKPNTQTSLEQTNPASRALECLASRTFRMDQLSEMLGKLKERSSTSLPIQNIFKYQIGKMMEYGYIYIYIMDNT